ncbi:MAG: hypothetical protein HY738_19025 [Bacteroidia bacterium]|nr:hypothetical protein [Bacteroidia bacterium]
MTILPYDSDELFVTFSSVTTGNISDNLTIFNNAGNISVCLEGVAVVPPIITVNPDSLAVTLNCGDSTTIPLEIFNNGGANLVWNAFVPSSLFDDFDPSVDISVWSSYTGVVSTNCGPFSGNGLYFDDAGTRQATTIAINTTGGGDISFYLMLPQGSAPCEAADAAGEDVVLEYSIDGGATWTIITTYIYNSVPNLTLFSQPIPPAAQTTATQFRWRQLFHSGTGYDNWILDNVSIDVQGWISLSPVNGTISPSNFTTVDVTFNSYGLMAGQYNSQISINSNDPLNPVVIIPCTMNVIGSFGIFLSGSCIAFDTIFVNSSISDTLQISSIGCDTLVITNITTNSSNFFTDTTSFIIPPYNTVNLIVTFSSTTAGNFYDSLTIFNNAGNISVCLTGVAVLPPIININPDSLFVTITNCIDSVLIPFEIYNSGSSELYFDIISADTTSPTGYCIPTYTNLCSTDDYINNFTFNTLSKLNSGCNGNTDNYILDLTITTKVYPGQTYPISMQSGSSWSQGFGVWIDYNQDGDFDEINEFVYASPTFGTSVFSANITIPTDVPLGKTRLRVRCAYETTLNSSNICTNFNYGETEDYEISIGDSFTATLANGTVQPFDSVTVYIQINTNGLSAGTYYYNILIVSNDPMNPSITLPVILNIEDYPLNSLISDVQDAACNALCDGSAIVLGQNGLAPYAYLWNDGQTSSNAINLCSGNYIVTITDNGGCTVSDTVTINEPAALSVTTTVTDADCGLSNGTASVSVTGGTPSYSYLWNTGLTDASVSGLMAGAYIITIFDSNGCDTSESVLINNINGPAVFIDTVIDVSCYGGCDGFASVSAAGGTPPYFYDWNTGYTGQNHPGLCQGEYFVSVTDSAGCISIEDIIIYEPDSLILSFSTTDDNGPGDGTATVNITGGTPPFSYNWNDSLSQTRQQIPLKCICM